MPRNSPGWRGVWYVYNHVTREFVRSMTGRTGVQWTPGLKYARPYKNPSQAQKCASRLNAMLHHPGSACWPCDSARPEGGLSLQAQERSDKTQVVREALPQRGRIPAAERSDRRGAVQPVSVVTGEAARCLDEINRRGGNESGNLSP